MMMSRKGLIAAAIAMVVCGCERKPEVPAPAADPYDTPYARMTDPVYTNLLVQQRQEQTDLASRLAKAKGDYAAARAKDAKSAETLALKAEVEKLKLKLAQNHSNSLALVRARIRQENAAIERRESTAK